MPYPKQPAPDRKRGVGVSLHPLTIRRVDALAGGTGKRSEFLGETIEIGLAARFGEDWREIADAAMTTTDLDARAA